MTTLQMIHCYISAIKLNKLAAKTKTASIMLGLMMSGMPSSILFAACPNFPANNVWNTPITTLPVHAYSENWKANMGNFTELRPDFGSGQWEGKDIGIPVTVTTTPEFKTFTFLYAAESDHKPYSLGAVEHGSDQHMITIDQNTCTLYETFNTNVTTQTADSGALFDLTSNAIRPAEWTSADAAGLPIYPGLVRYDEIAAGAINHAIRFTVEKTNSNTWPATHKTMGIYNTPIKERPPLGARFRLKADIDISNYDPANKIILTAMKTYGIILADNGSDWFLSGTPDPRWDNESLSQLRKLRGKDFEAVDSTCMIVSPTSYAANPSKCTTQPTATPTPAPTPKSITSSIGTTLSISVPAATKQIIFNLPTK